MSCLEGYKVQKLPSSVAMKSALLAALLGSVSPSSLTMDGELTILSLTPSVDHSSPGKANAPVGLSGREAITLTFSRAVIPLGADFASLPERYVPFVLSPAVAGNVRWVTTSIARFDPVADWPPELEVTLRLNPKLRTFDGRGVDGSAGQWHFTTPPIGMSARRVRSALATRHTNGTWSASLHPLDADSLEMPPDGELELRFSADVRIGLLERALMLRPLTRERGQSARSLTLAPCRAAYANAADAAYASTTATRCVLVALAAGSAPLEVGALYDVLLPSGASFHESAGKTHAEHHVRLSGLVPFALPFRDGRYLTPRYRRLRLWLRHGLASGMSAADMAPFIELTSEGGDLWQGSRRVGFELRRLSAAVLQLEAPLAPRTRYTLRVRASSAVRDGFGLPLQRAAVTFTTAELPSLFLQLDEPRGGLRFSAHNRSALAAMRHWPVLVRPCEYFGAPATTFDALTVADVPAALALTTSPRAVVSGALREATRLGAVSPSLGTDETLRVATADLGHALMGAPGLLLHATRGLGASAHGAMRSTLVSAGEIGATTLALPGAPLIIWVVNATSALPLPSAAVTLLAADCYRCTAPEIQHVATAATDADGLAAFDMATLSTRHFRTLHAMIVAPPHGAHAHAGGAPAAAADTVEVEPREMLVLKDVPRPYATAPPSPTATLITDRGAHSVLALWVSLVGAVRLATHRLRPRAPRPVLFMRGGHQRPPQPPFKCPPRPCCPPTPSTAPPSLVWCAHSCVQGE